MKSGPVFLPNWTPRSAPNARLHTSEQRRVVLVISPFEEDPVVLERILDGLHWEAQSARSCREALAMLHDRPAPILVSDCNLPDGNWKDILNAIALAADAPHLIVTSRLADEYLWSEVLNLGGYDVLARPFDAKEVARVVSLAWRHWKNEGARAGSGAAKFKAAV